MRNSPVKVRNGNTYVNTFTHWETVVVYAMLLCVELRYVETKIIIIFRIIPWIMHMVLALTCVVLVRHQTILTAAFRVTSLTVGLHAIFLWTSYQIRIVGCACAGNAGNVFPPPLVSDPDMHQGTCVTHVPWCMPGSLTSDFLWSRWRGKCSRHSRRMRNWQVYVYGKRPTVNEVTWNILLWK